MTLYRVMITRIISDLLTLHIPTKQQEVQIKGVESHMKGQSEAIIRLLKEMKKKEWKDKKKRKKGSR
jgi:hypothetical protein